MKSLTRAQKRTCLFVLVHVIYYVKISFKLQYVRTYSEFTKSSILTTPLYSTKRRIHCKQNFKTSELKKENMTK
jgi:hypothetical protein